MTQDAAKRPTGITVVAWVWIALGGLMLFSGVMGGAALAMMKSMGAPPPPPDAPVMFSLMFNYFWLLLLLQAIVAVLAMSAGIALLRLKQWGRTTLEVLSWLGLAYIIGFSILWLFMWFSDGPMADQDTPPEFGFVNWFVIAMMIAVTATFATPLAFIIRYLRGTEARAAVTAR